MLGGCLQKWVKFEGLVKLSLLLNFCFWILQELDFVIFLVNMIYLLYFLLRPKINKNCVEMR
jgi:hypothetical protein